MLPPSRTGRQRSKTDQSGPSSKRKPRKSGTLCWVRVSLYKCVVARDGIEPPTPAFSGPRSTTELSGLGVDPGVCAEAQRASGSGSSGRADSEPADDSPSIPKLMHCAKPLCPRYAQNTQHQGPLYLVRTHVPRRTPAGEVSSNACSHRPRSWRSRSSAFTTPPRSTRRDESDPRKGRHR